MEKIQAQYNFYGFCIQLALICVLVMTSIFTIPGFSWFCPAVIAETTAQRCCITRFDHGQLNWTTGKVQATGRAVPPEKEMAHVSDYIFSAARADAGKNLISILKTIRVTSKKSVDDHIASKDRLMAGVEEIARDAVIVKQHYTSDRAMEVTLEASILRGFLQLVLPEEISQIPKIQAIDSALNCKDPSDPYTGLIIDVRGLDFKPILYPVVASEQGHDIYSAVFISREHAVQNGVCQYICSPDLPVQTQRAGGHPLVIKGLRKSRKNNSTIVITWSDAEKIESAFEHYRFMRQCKVIILMDPPSCLGGSSKK
ncbi:MAG: hypothetical protein U9P10_09935 [Thermodesulfobacteriota bacterium]|nr:hypothetical protein [Thermodesulfobacteriota bacterium]